MAKNKIAQFMLDRIKESGVDITFGIPGDYVLPVYAAQERSGLKTVVMTHEPSVGFAADAYARIKGLGVALVTYGTGGLNMINSVALAYAEESPLLVISGSPDTKFRSQKPELHHCVKSFDTQLKVMAEVTESQALITNPKTAQEEIDRVITTTKKRSRPGYLELPRDVLNAEIEISTRVPSSVGGEPRGLSEALAEIEERLGTAQRPIIMAGVQIHRFKTIDKLVGLVDNLNIPVVTSILGKTAFPESHPNFIGSYFGKFADPRVREYVESSDLILCLGAVLTEMETGGYSASLPQEKLVLANSHELTIGQHSYPHIDFSMLLNRLLESTTNGALKGKKFTVPSIPAEPFDLEPEQKALSVGAMMDSLNKMLDDKFRVVSDLGDCLYAGMGLKTDQFIAPGNYSSMGFGVPAGIGAQLAEPKRRSLILAGDGGFQMTGNELATAVKMGINPIVVLFDNASYAMMRFIDQKKDYYQLSRWDYAGIAKALGATGIKATSKHEFDAALKSAKGMDGPLLIDCIISETDISPTLRRLTDHFGQKLRATAS
jgi:indolepyruvate decarboxylase